MLSPSENQAQPGLGASNGARQLFLCALVVWQRGAKICAQ